MIQESNTVENLFKEAVHCQFCFTQKWVSPSLINIAQPRWIGSQYYVSEPKILIIPLNPGSGGDIREANRRLLRLLEGYRDGVIKIDEIFQHQANDIRNWGRGRFAKFYLDGLNLHLDTVAFANIAWCASPGNPPKYMLSECFRRHTSALIQLLAPEVVILSGNKAHDFGGAIRRIMPSAEIIYTLHYAHREGFFAEAQELARVKEIIRAIQTDKETGNK